jgi:hypothetical protein
LLPCVQGISFLCSWAYAGDGFASRVSRSLVRREPLTAWWSQTRPSWASVRPSDRPAEPPTSVTQRGVYGTFQCKSRHALQGTQHRTNPKDEQHEHPVTDRGHSAGDPPESWLPIYLTADEEDVRAVFWRTRRWTSWKQTYSRGHWLLLVAARPLVHKRRSLGISATHLVS